MSAYDQHIVAHHSARISVERALRRATAVTVNSQAVITPPPQPVPALSPNFVTTPNRYPAYNLGYAPGDKVVTRPYLIANPPAVQNQCDTTSNHTYNNFSSTDLPAILFRVEPYNDVFSNIEVPVLHDLSTGQPVVTRRNATLRFFSFLPRYISYGVSGALLEFWFRLDHRLEMNDILMRIESGGGHAITGANARNNFQMRRQRFRERIGIISWNDSRSWPVKRDVDLVGDYTPQQICLNTAMTVDVPNGRLLKPIYSDEDCSDHLGYIDSGLPLNFYLSRLVTTAPTKRMLATIALRQKVQEVAIGLGLGNQPDNWKVMDRAHEPRWWSAGQNKPADTPRNDLHGESWMEWMEREMGSNMGVGILQRRATRGVQI